MRGPKKTELLQKVTKVDVQVMTSDPQYLQSLTCLLRMLIYGLGNCFLRDHYDDNSDLYINKLDNSGDFCHSSRWPGVVGALHLMVCVNHLESESFLLYASVKTSIKIVSGLRSATRL